MGGDDFDKRDSLSPIRKAVQEGIKEKEMANDARKASEIRNNEAMCNQIDYFLSGLCELFDVPEQIEKTIRQSGIDGKPHKYEFSLSARSFHDAKKYGDKGMAIIMSEISEALPQMDNELLFDWINKLYSSTYGGQWNGSYSKNRYRFEVSGTLEYDRKKCHLRNISANRVPEQGTSAFREHMKRYFFYLLEEGFSRDGIQLHHLEMFSEKIYVNNEKEIECGTIRDYIGEVCYENGGCNRRCDWPDACNWAFEILCPECKYNPHGIDDDCTNMVRNYQMSFPILKFEFTINPE